jgi:ribosomal subunit interface protein
VGSKTRSAGRVPRPLIGWKGLGSVEIIFNGRQTDVPARFREYATAKLTKFEKLDQKALRVDVVLSAERNPRMAGQKERVELTISSKGPTIRAEAAAEDRFAALDLALAKLDAQLRRALDRRKSHYAPHDRAEQRETEAILHGFGLPGQLSDEIIGTTPASAGGTLASPRSSLGASGSEILPSDAEAEPSDSVVPIEMEGDGPLVVRQKFHRAHPISIDQALLEMELVGHDFYLFHDIEEDMPSVVYRRCGYQYGVIRLVESPATHEIPEAQAAPSQGADGLPAPAARQPAAIPARRQPLGRMAGSGQMSAARR